MQRRHNAGMSILLALLILAISALYPAPAKATFYPKPVAAIAVAAGNDNTCAATFFGGVRCWGYNGFGQLGNNTTTSSSIPVTTTLTFNGATDVAVGYSYSCAVIAGGAKCWGQNTYGQLGDNSTTNRHTPVAVDGLSSGVTAIAANAGYHTCAIVNGGAKCWGYNYWGQLGNDATLYTSTNSSVPVSVYGLSSGITAIAAGGVHSCALTSGGAVKCWGQNTYGQLGNGSTTNSSRPVDVTGLSSGVVAISAGDINSCAVLNSGTVKCWGQNYVGQLGNGNSGPGADSNVPVSVSGISNAAQSVNAVATGGAHSCVLLDTGAAKCWGYGGDGVLGNDSSSNNSTPVSVNNLTTGTAITASSGHTCALLSDGSVKCWGNNANGKLGDDTSSVRDEPVAVKSLGPIDAIPSWWNGDSCDATFYNANKDGGGNATVLTSWRGFQVCGPLPGIDGNASRSFGIGVSQWEWQCAELAKRYLYVAYGLAPITGNGIAVATNYNTTYNTAFNLVDVNQSSFEVTGHIFPQEGSVISYNSGASEGHVAIVKGVTITDATNGDATIYVIEQNASGTGLATDTMDNWVYDAHSVYTAKNWITLK